MRLEQAPLTRRIGLPYFRFELAYPAVSAMQKMAKHSNCRARTLTAKTVKITRTRKGVVHRQPKKKRRGGRGRTVADEFPFASTEAGLVYACTLFFFFRISFLPHSCFVPKNPGCVSFRPLCLGWDGFPSPGHSKLAQTGTDRAGA